MQDQARVLHLYKSYRPEMIGGIAEVIASITKLRPDIFNHRVLVCRNRPGLSYDEGIPVFAAKSFGDISSMPIAPNYPGAIRKALKRADLLVHHGPFPLTDIALLGAKRIPLIVHWHADLVRSRWVTTPISPLLRHTLQIADRIVVSSDAIVESSQLLRDFAGKCKAIPYSVDYDFWSHVNSDQRAQVTALRARFPRLVVAAGRLVPYKGFDVLIDAMNQINGTLMLIGTGPLASELEAQRNRLGLQDRIHFKGFASREEMKTLFHAGRVFAFPSVSPAEAFGIVQLEAMACGLPVVNTNLSTTVPHVARNQAEGLTVAPSDPFALATAVNTVLDDPDLRDRLGAAARSRARDVFSKPQFLSRIEDLYCAVLSSRDSQEEWTTQVRPAAV